jgi:uncharacterized membrane protein
MYRGLFGGLILIFLYFDLTNMIYVMIGMLFFEGLTNLRIPILTNRLIGRIDAIAASQQTRLNMDSERVWRLVVGTMLLITFGILYQYLWFFPWFMGLAILGAGISGVCPVLFAIQWSGFR